MTTVCILTHLSSLHVEKEHFVMSIYNFYFRIHCFNNLLCLFCKKYTYFDGL